MDIYQKTTQVSSSPFPLRVGDLERKSIEADTVEKDIGLCGKYNHIKSWP